MKDTSIQNTWIKHGMISNDLGKLFLTSHNLPSRIRITRNSTALLSRIIRNHDSAYSSFWISCLLLSLFRVANAWNSASFFPFHCKYAHSLFWYLGSVLSAPGIRSIFVASFHCYHQTRSSTHCRFQCHLVQIAIPLAFSWRGFYLLAFRRPISSILFYFFSLLYFI